MCVQLIFNIFLLGKPKASTHVAKEEYTLLMTYSVQAVSISHYSVIANVIQMAAHFRLGDPLWPKKLISPGDVAVGGERTEFTSLVARV
jgi:hypothetical protein